MINKHQTKSKKEQLRHNKIMEADQKKMAKALGSGLYLKQEGKGMFYIFFLIRPT